MGKANLSLVKNINYSLVWDNMLNCSATTIANISDNLKLSFPTISRAIEYGLTCGLILEGEQQDSAVGRKATKYKINPDFEHILIVVTDSGMLRGTVLNMLGVTVSSFDKKFDYSSFDKDLIQFISVQKQNNALIKSVGIALECVVSHGVIVDWTKNPQFVGYDLAKKLKEEIDIDVTIDNNMKALALGATNGQYRKEKLTIATLQNGYSGFGASIVVGGEVFRGATNFAGEIGYLPKNFGGMVDSNRFATFAQTLISVINPHKIIVYDKFNEIDAQTLIAQLERVLPDYAMPEIIKSNKFFDDCMNGIYQLVKRQIFKNILSK